MPMLDTGQGQLPVEPELLVESGTTAAAVGSVQEAEEGVRPPPGGDVGFVGERACHRRRCRARGI